MTILTKSTGLPSLTFCNLMDVQGQHPILHNQIEMIYLDSWWWRYHKTILDWFLFLQTQILMSLLQELRGWIESVGLPQTILQCWYDWTHQNSPMHQSEIKKQQSLTMTNKLVTWYNHGELLYTFDKCYFNLTLFTCMHWTVISLCLHQLIDFLWVILQSTMHNLSSAQSKTCSNWL